MTWHDVLFLAPGFLCLLGAAYSLGRVHGLRRAREILKDIYEK